MPPCGPAFARDGSVTAGNSSGINDGAAALLLVEADRARALGLRPMARVVATAVAGVHPDVMGMGPVPAVRKALDRAGLGVGDLDVIEINEAFASQSVACADELGFDPARVNPNGGAIALGHPLGASGARLMTMLVHELRTDGRTLRPGHHVHRRRAGDRHGGGADRGVGTATRRVPAPARADLAIDRAAWVPPPPAPNQRPPIPPEPSATQTPSGQPTAAPRPSPAWPPRF